MLVGDVRRHRPLQVYDELWMDFQLLALGVPRHDPYLRQADPDLRVQVYLPVLVGADDSLSALEGLSLVLRDLLFALLRHVVAAQNDVVDRLSDGVAVRGLEQVLRGEHQQPRLGLSVC